MEYWREGSTSMSPSSASDVMGQHNKIGGINFGATLIFFQYVACSILGETLMYLKFLGF
jgi:hypothetical protein